MPIDKFTQRPSPGSDKPSLPQSFKQTPSGAGSQKFGGGPDAGKSTSGGVPSKVQKASGTENKQSRKDLNSGQKGIKASVGDVIPSAVDRFRQTP